MPIKQTKRQLENLAFIEKLISFFLNSCWCCCAVFRAIATIAVAIPSIKLPTSCNVISNQSIQIDRY